MLTIRHEQMKVLEADADRRFFLELLSIAAVHHPQIENLSSRVEAAMERAVSYGIWDRDDLLWFLDLDLERGAAWELQPGSEWAFDILDAPESDVAGRRYRLEKRLVQMERA